jgi:hypothetical protein
MQARMTRSVVLSANIGKFTHNAAKTPATFLLVFLPPAFLLNFSMPKKIISSVVFLTQRLGGDSATTQTCYLCNRLTPVVTKWKHCTNNTCYSAPPA